MKSNDNIHYYNNKHINTKNVPSIISRDCCGWYLYQSLALPYTSPTIGLYMGIEDFILFCCHLEAFLASEVVEYTTNKKFPVGAISCKYGTIYLYFMHYESFSDAKAKWDNRKDRVDFDNIVVICDGKRGIEQNIIQKFGQIPYKKILLSSGIDIEQYPFGYNMKCYNSDTPPETLIKHLQQRKEFVYLDEFDWSSFFN